MKLQLKRSNVLISGAAKEPTASQLDYGELAINYSAGDAAIFLKDSTNNVIRISGVGNIADDGLTNVPTTTSPPTTPTPEAGNLWYNSEDGRLYIYYVDDNSSQWVDASPDTWQTTVIPDTTNPAHQAGTLDDRYINTNGDTLTGALLLDNAATVATPDLAFDGDLNTGIYSPGADSLAITTAGTQRVTVDSAGRLLVGTSTNTDDYKFQVDSNAYQIAQFTRYGSDGAHLVIGSSRGTQASKTALGVNDYGGVLEFKAYQGSAFSSIASIRGSCEAAAASGDTPGRLTFWTTSDNQSSVSERMRIDSSGNVGIGDSSPDARCVVYRPTQFAGNTAFSVKTDSGSTKSTKFMVDGNGNVGIGTTAPSAQIEIEGNVSSTTQFSGFQGLRIQNANGSSYGVTADINFVAGTSSNNRGAVIGAQFESGTNGNALYFATNGSSVSSNDTPTERMRIDSSGNVGIGTASPSETLHVVGSIRTGTVDDFIYTNNLGHISSSQALALVSNSETVFKNTSNQERVRIDSSGRLLLGTSSSRAISGLSSQRLQIEGTDGTGSSLSIINNQNSVGRGSIRFGKSRGTSLGSNTIVANGDSLGDIVWSGADGTDLASDAASIKCEIDDYPGSNDMPGRLVFSTTADGASSPTERMRIDRSGNVGIGTTITSWFSGVDKLVVRNDSNTGTSSAILAMQDQALQYPITCWNTSNYTNTSLMLFRVGGAANGVGTISSNGSSTSYNTSSDYRLKENVVNIANGITRVKQLKPRRFNFIIDAETTVDGFVAHEAQAVVPEAVTGEKDGEEMQGIDQAKLVPLLTAALQEAVAKIETLEQRLSDAGIA